MVLTTVHLLELFAAIFVSIEYTGISLMKNHKDVAFQCGNLFTICLM